MEVIAPFALGNYLIIFYIYIIIRICFRSLIIQITNFGSDIIRTYIDSNGIIIIIIIIRTTVKTTTTPPLTRFSTRYTQPRISARTVQYIQARPAQLRVSTYLISHAKKRVSLGSGRVRVFFVCRAEVINGW